ncbi:MAG TPA: trypsin-like peptidase domain-containing protein [Planctomycetota bacterium]|nr:trypsin-like peptidase domain-containing protein [Planctomycetota bacterium]
MTRRATNWSVTLGIIFGVVLGVIVSKSLDHWPTPVIADAKDANGKKMAYDQAAIFRNASKIIGPAVVNVTTLQRVRYREGGGISFNELGVPFYNRPKIKEGLYPRGVGSGFIFDAQNGYVMTNNHVVSEGETYVIRLADKRELEAKLVGSDPQTDIAVLKVEARELTGATLGDSDTLEVGDWVLAVGNPFGLLEQTVTAGIISAKSRKGVGISNYEDFLQTDAAINPGNSGGPLVNLNGEVVGVNTAIFSRSGGYMGIGFSIPINQARKIALKLIKGGAVTRGWVGVEVKDLTAAEMKQLKVENGAAVEGVYLRGPAHKAGLLPGDVLLKLGGKQVTNSSDIRDAVADLEPGQKIDVLVKRKEETKTLSMIVGTQPKDWGINNKNAE